MKMLRAKLVELQMQEKAEKISDLKGVQLKIEWGSQIRSYVFMPYQMVKDNRTAFETSNINSVMDGDLVYIAAESYPFMYVDVKDGDCFRYYADIPLSDEDRNIPGPAEVWHKIHNVIGLETGEFQLAAFPDHTFRWGNGKIETVHEGKSTALVEDATIYYLIAVDLNFDNQPEICASIYTENKGEHVLIYDVANDDTHIMHDSDGAYVYYLYTRYVDGHYYVMCAKDDAKTGKVVEAGRLYFPDGKTPSILAPTLGSLSSDTVTILFDWEHPDTPHQGEVELEGFLGVTVRWYFAPNYFGNDRPVIVKDGKETLLFENFPSPTTMYITDVTGDGKPDLCADVYYFFSGMPSFNAVCVYDYANDRYYMLSDSVHTSHAKKISYYLRMVDGKLLCDKVNAVFDVVPHLGDKDQPQRAIYVGHPNVTGCKVWAEALYPLMKDVLSK
jgi:hypothetical protein